MHTIGPEADVRAILELRDEMNAADEVGDLDRYLSHCTEDMAVMPPGDSEPFVGRETARERLAATFESKADHSREHTYHSDAIVVRGDQAYDSGYLVSRSGDPDDDSESRFAYVDIYRRTDDGTWAFDAASWFPVSVATDADD